MSSYEPLGFVSSSPMQIPSGRSPTQFPGRLNYLPQGASLSSSVSSTSTQSFRDSPIGTPDLSSLKEQPDHYARLQETQQKSVPIESFVGDVAPPIGQPAIGKTISKYNGRNVSKAYACCSKKNVCLFLAVTCIAVGILATLTGVWQGFTEKTPTTNLSQNWSKVVIAGVVTAFSGGCCFVACVPPGTVKCCRVSSCCLRNEPFNDIEELP